MVLGEKKNEIDPLKSMDISFNMYSCSHQS